MDYKLIRAKRRTISLRIDDDGTLVVRAPIRMPEFHIVRIIEEKIDWILRHRSRVLTRRTAPKQLVPGATLPYLGREYQLQIDQNAFLKVALTDTLTVPLLSKARLKILLTHWYKEQAKKIFAERAGRFASEMGVSFSKIRISDAQSRWGSCSIHGNLNFSWRLVMAPLDIIDYVVVHELAHIKQMNHSKAFWAEVAAVLPDYQARRRWIKQHGHNLSF